MKKTIFLIAIISVLCMSACSQSNLKAENNNMYNFIFDEPTNAYFTNEEVKLDDLKTIVTAGINSPSAMNSQPWHFTIINSKSKLEKIGTVMKEIMGKMKPPAGMKAPNGMKPGLAPQANVNEEAKKAGKIAPKKADISSVPACIIISCKRGNEYDAGLATTNISQMAKVLGYATKIVSSPKEAIKTEEMKKEYGVPNDMDVVGVVLIGKEDKTITPDYDGYTSATVRNGFDEMVSIIE